MLKFGVLHHILFMFTFSILHCVSKTCHITVRHGTDDTVVRAMNDINGKCRFWGLSHNNLSKNPIKTSFGTLISQLIGHLNIVSISHITYCNCLTPGNCQTWQIVNLISVFVNPFTSTEGIMNSVRQQIYRSNDKL